MKSSTYIVSFVEIAGYAVEEGDRVINAQIERGDINGVVSYGI